MKYRLLGKTELNVSEISLGCSGFWGNRKFPDDKAISVVCEAFERGVNFFDTGHNYCSYNAEPRLGRAIKKIMAHNDRSRLIISTKAGTVSPSTSRMPFTKPNNTNFTPDYIEATCAQSIKNLNCNYLDIFQLHGITAESITEPLLQRLLLMKQKGMYRYLGINTHKEADMHFVSKHAAVFDMVLIDFNVLQLDRLPIIDILKNAGIGVMAGTVLGQGHLIKGKIGKLRTAADIWYLARATLKPTGRRLAKNASKMSAVLASITEMTPAQTAIAYVLDNPAIASCVLGTVFRIFLRLLMHRKNNSPTQARMRFGWLMRHNRLQSVRNFDGRLLVWKCAIEVTSASPHPTGGVPWV